MKQAALLAITMGFLLSGCDKLSHQKGADEITNQANQKSPEEIKKEASINLLNDISGVWTDQGGLITIHYDSGKLQLIIGDEPIIAQVGDIDPVNNTVNILVTKKIDGEEGIFTVTKKMNPEGTAFTLLIHLFDGTTHNLSFVRKIGTDDINRINRIYKNAQDEADALAEQQARYEAEIAEQEQYEPVDEYSEDINQHTDQNEEENLAEANQNIENEGAL